MDYGNPLQFGVFVTPTSAVPQQSVEIAKTAERAGFDLVTFQDHPYQPAFLDAWTLMSYVAAETDRVHIAGNVLNLPLRPPAVLARAAASLDLLSGGRVELALGAGAFADGIAAMGGPRRTPGQARRALEEAIAIIREIWHTDARGGVHVKGSEYVVDGAKRGPRPAHDIGIWIGAYGPRMLDLVGRSCDGWVPSLSYLPNGIKDLAGLNARIDDAAQTSGRQPSAIRRFLNLGGSFGGADEGFSSGSTDAWAAHLARLTLEDGISGFIFATDDEQQIEHIGRELIPATRALVDAERS
ncbi:LLM class flavin-dependent oxidoreductase [Jongsikchunia kroppenstedtii]|uniref:LLM class flavin-dependent oxidoreductase n=1 Tax=Jongsikchunia kroppenstedtii TaxID=1121721 RepID=UPI00036F90AB|nr:LLM class flavin-dependent oxidoreductase [Jongsikchunia kroppenstedtii]